MFTTAPPGGVVYLALSRVRISGVLVSSMGKIVLNYSVFDY